MIWAAGRSPNTLGLFAVIRPRHHRSDCRCCQDPHHLRLPAVSRLWLVLSWWAVPVVPVVPVVAAAVLWWEATPVPWVAVR